METMSERRRRKLIDLANEHGGPAGIADDCGVSADAIDQVIKGTLLPPKRDGSRNPKGLGDDAARKIEDGYKLGRGWFDADDLQQTLPPAPVADDLFVALTVISEVIKPASKLARLALVPMFTVLAMEPEQVHEVAQQMRALLPPPPPPPPDSDNGSGPPEPIGGPLPPTSRFPRSPADEKRPPVQGKNPSKR